MNLDLDTMFAAFEVDASEPPRRLIRTAEREAGLAPLVISLAVRAGHPLGSGSRDVLARDARRAATYRQALELVRSIAPAKVLKGAALAQWYPEGAVRPTGDLDLLVQDESALWAVGRMFMDAYGAAPTLLTRIQGTDAVHFCLGLQWPSEDPLTESDYEIELVTFPYGGDGAAVPLIADVPEHPGLSQLIAVAEERFQRAYGIKDAIDCAVVLSRFPDCFSRPGSITFVEAACRAPEVEELVTFSRERLGEVAGHVPAPLARLAAAEHRRRDQAPRTGGWRDGPAGVTFGLLLPSDMAPPPRTAVTYDTPGGQLLRTPVGDYLMVTGERVPQEDVEAALRHRKVSRSARSVQ